MISISQQDVWRYLKIIYKRKTKSANLFFLFLFSLCSSFFIYFYFQNCTLSLCVHNVLFISHSPQGVKPASYNKVMDPEIKEIIGECICQKKENR